MIDQNQNPPKELRSDKAFRELCFGDYEGLSEDKRKIACSKVILGHGDLHIINQQLKERKILPAEMMNAIYSIDTSGYAESYEQVQKRSITRLHDIAQEIERAGGGNILIVSHGVSISAMIDYLPGEKLKKVSDMKNMSVTILDYKDDSLGVETVASMKYVLDGKI